MAEILQKHVWMRVVMVVVVVVVVVVAVLVVVVVVMVVMALTNLVLNANSQVPLQRQAQLSAKIARV
jgi:cell division septal protein FtsQ